MRGYIREYRTGKWSYTCYIGKDDKGKNKKVEKGGFTSKKECEAALSKKLAEIVDTGTIFIPSEKTFETVFNEFMENKKYSWSPSVNRSRQGYYKNHLKKTLGYRYIKAIKTSDINDVLTNLLNKGYKPQTVISIKQVISGTCRYAVDHKYIRSNPCDHAIIPKIMKSKIEIFTPDEIKQILDITKNSVLFPTVFIPLYTGMRVGEVMGLRWSDIDFKNKTIDINKQLLWEHGKKSISEPKHNSDRAIYMPQILVDMLKDLKAKQEYNKKILADRYQIKNRVYSYFDNQYIDIDDFLCVREDGVLINRGSACGIIKMCAKHGIVFYHHKLRHTYATTLLESGCSIKLLQEILGHKSATFTLNIYSHVSKAHEHDIIDKLPVY